MIPAHDRGRGGSFLGLEKAIRDLKEGSSANSPRCSSVQLFEQQRHVGAAKPKGVGHRVLNNRGSTLLGNVVHQKSFVGFLEVDRRRDHATGYSENCKRGLDCTGSTEQVTDSALCGADQRLLWKQFLFRVPKLEKTQEDEENRRDRANCS